MPHICANLAQNSCEFPTELLVLERRRQRMVTPSVRQILRENSLVREILKSKTREPGGVSRWTAEGNRARNILIRCPATYNGTFDSRAQLPRQCVDMVLTGTFPNIGSMRISRVCLTLICGQFSADTISQAQACGKNRRKTEAVKSDKRRQRTCRNLPLFVTGSCRNLLLSVQCN